MTGTTSYDLTSGDEEEVRVALEDGHTIADSMELYCDNELKTIHFDFGKIEYQCEESESTNEEEEDEHHTFAASNDQFYHSSHVAGGR